MSKLIFCSLLFPCLAPAYTITQTISCTVKDSLGHVVSNSCVAPDGSTISDSGVLSGQATPSLMDIESAPQIIFSYKTGSPYVFSMTESFVITGEFELVGGTGTAYIKADISDRCCQHNGQISWVQGGAYISGGLTDLNDGMCYPGICTNTFGSFNFNQPFTETLVASVSVSNLSGGFYGVTGAQGDYYADSSIEPLSIVDSSGDAISGAQLVECSTTPEPGTWILWLSGAFYVAFGLARKRKP